MEITFDAQLWIWPGNGSWHFVSVPADAADEIEARFGSTAGGFGSIKVQVRIGLSQWSTSLFPSTAEKTYVLPVKKAVRTAQGVGDGDTVTVHLTIGDPG